MFRKIKEKMIERELNKIEKVLRKIDYVELKHTLMKIKWIALKTQDNEAYNEVEDYEKIANVLEEVFGKEKQICQ